MRIFNATFVIATALLFLTSCNIQTGEIEFNKNKLGGLFEIDGSGKEYAFYNGKESFKLNPSTYISLADFDQIVQRESQHEGVYSIFFKLNDAGTLKFKEMTERNIGKPICFLIGHKVIAAPTVQGVIPNGQVEVTVADKKAIDEMVEYLTN